MRSQGRHEKSRGRGRQDRRQHPSTMRPGRLTKGVAAPEQAGVQRHQDDRHAELAIERGGADSGALAPATRALRKIGIDRPSAIAAGVAHQPQKPGAITALDGDVACRAIAQPTMGCKRARASSRSRHGEQKGVGQGLHDDWCGGDDHRTGRQVSCPRRTWSRRTVRRSHPGRATLSQLRPRPRRRGAASNRINACQPGR